MSEAGAGEPPEGAARAAPPAAPGGHETAPLPFALAALVWGALGGLAFALLPSACVIAGAVMAPFLTVPPLAAALFGAFLFVLGAAAGAAVCAARRASAAGRPTLARLALSAPLLAGGLAAPQLAYAHALHETADPARALAAATVQLDPADVTLALGLGLAAALVAAAFRLVEADLDCPTAFLGAWLGARASALTSRLLVITFTAGITLGLMGLWAGMAGGDALVSIPLTAGAALCGASALVSPVLPLALEQAAELERRLASWIGGPA